MRGSDVDDRKPEPEPEPEPQPEPPQEITCSGGLMIKKPGAGNGK